LTKKDVKKGDFERSGNGKKLVNPAILGREHIPERDCWRTIKKRRTGGGVGKKREKIIAPDQKVVLQNGSGQERNGGGENPEGSWTETGRPKSSRKKDTRTADKHKKTATEQG